MSKKPKLKKTRVPLTREEATRIGKLADRMVERIICSETLRLALPIVRLMMEKTIVQYKRIQDKYGEVI